MKDKLNPIELLRGMRDSLALSGFIFMLLKFLELIPLITVMKALAILGAIQVTYQASDILLGDIFYEEE